MESAWDLLDILKPLFFFAKAMALGNVRNAYVNAAFQILSTELEVVCESERLDFRPRPEDLAANRRLLAAVYIPRRSNEGFQVHCFRKQLGMRFLEFVLLIVLGLRLCIGAVGVVPIVDKRS